MQNQFDELSKALAQQLPRRELLRRVGGLLALSALGSFGLTRTAWASGECGRLCRRLHPRQGRLRTQCILDCDRVRPLCPDLDEECLRGAMSTCRARCGSQGFSPRGGGTAQKNWNQCMFVCGQCLSRDGGLCYKDTPRGRVSVCCCPEGQTHCPDPNTGSFVCCESPQRCED